MTFRDTADDYTQNFNVENELASVVNNGSTTTFAYDAAGIRTKAIAPSGVTTYYPSLLRWGLPGLVWPVFNTVPHFLPVTSLFANGPLPCFSFGIVSWRTSPGATDGESG